MTKYLSRFGFKLVLKNLVSLSKVSSLLASVSMVLVLTACQTTPNNTASPFVEVPKPAAERVVMTEDEMKGVLAAQKTRAGKTLKNRDVAFHCSGLYSCDIASIDKKPVINHRSGKPYRSAIRNRLLYIKENTESNSAKFSYVGLMSSGEHLVNIRFYPISEGAFENFAVRHAFKKDKVYRFHGYRKAVDTPEQPSDVSLLALASPRPMCIAIYEDRQPIRQFCKEADIITGVGRFVEEPVSSPTADKPKLMDGFQDGFFRRFSNG